MIDEPHSLEEQFSSMLAACDEALAEGTPPKVFDWAGDPPELRTRLERGLACLQRLQHLRPRRSPMLPRGGDTPQSPPPTTPSATTDHNLLFGVIALQADMIDNTQFVEACALWAAHKHVPLADLLVERGWLTARDRADVGRLVERKLDKHAGDAHASLAAAAGDAVRHALAALDDVSIRDSVAGLPDPGRRAGAGTVDFAPQSRQRYTLTRLHGKGGIGQVWLARDADLGRNVALKELRQERTVDPTVVERFFHEAQITGQLEHPGIVPIYEMSRNGISPTAGPVSGFRYLSDGQGTPAAELNDMDKPFYTMRFIKGRTLTEAIQTYHQQGKAGKAGPLGIIELVNAFVDVCHAVAYAHSRGVIHRDLKGQNVVLGDFGEVIVLDWGFAKVLPLGATNPLSIVPGESCHESRLLPIRKQTTDNEHLTLDGQVIGTPAFMAPEQADGRLDELDRRTDVYGLGAMLYELLTGRPPFVGADVQEVLRQVRAEEPPRPRRIWAGAPPALEAICLRALAKKPSERYASAVELARDVQRWLADESVAAYGEPLLPRLGRWARRHKPHVAGLAAVVLTAVVALVVTTMVIREDQVRFAEREHALEDRALVRIQATREGLERTSYLKDVALAEREVAERNVARADELLEECLPHLRLWEWHYLHRRTHRCVLTLRGHEQSVISVAYSPDGQQLAAGGDREGIVMIWDTTTGGVLHTLDGHQSGTSRRLAYRPPDGRHLAVAGPNRSTVQIWDTTNGRLDHDLSEHTGYVPGVAYSPDGQHLATASLDKTVKIRDAETGQVLHTFEHAFQHLQVAYSHDGKRLAVSNETFLGVGKDGIVLILDALTREEIHTLGGHTGAVNTGPVNTVKFSPDDRLLAACARDDVTVTIWDVINGKEIHELRSHKGELLDLAFSPDGKLLASASFDGTFKVWDVASGSLLRTFRGHAHFVSGVAFSPDSRHLATSSFDKTVRVWDITDLTTNTGPEAVELLPAHLAGVRHLAFSPDGQRFASASADHTVIVWDTRTLQATQILRGHNAEVLSVAFHPNSKGLASAGADGTVKLWDAIAGGEIPAFPGHTGPVRSVVFSDKGRRLTTAGDDRMVRFWDTTTGLAVGAPSGHKDITHIHNLSPDVKQLVGTDVGERKSLTLRDALTGRELRSLRRQADSVACVTFSGDGRHLALADQDAKKDWTIRILDLTAPQPQLPAGIEIEAEPATLNLKGHTEKITVLAFSPDSRRLVSASEDKTARVWDIDLETNTGQEVLSLRDHNQPITSVAFSPDGNLIVAGDCAGMVRVWNGTPLEADAGPAAPGKR